MDYWLRLFGVFFFTFLLSACLDSNASNSSSSQMSDCSGCNTSGTGGDQSHDVDAFQYLNALRKQAGMINFSRNAYLDKATLAHAKYLNANNASGHDETNGNSGFTGATPNERAHAAGYKGTVSENVSTHSKGSYRESIDGLFSAIYHRFAFLTLDHNEVGIGSDQTNSSNNAAYVYNMGNSNIVTLCSGSSFSGVGQYVYDVCSDSNFKIEKSQYDSASTSIGQTNPDIIRWPAESATDIPPVFFEEVPDPLAAYSVSGYPLSVEFNQYKYATAPSVSSFTLTKVSDQSFVNLIQMSDGKYYMDQNNDPQSRFSAYQYAIFPQKRLEWATEYQVDVTYNDGAAKTLSWKFTTRNPGYKVYTVTTSGTVINSVSSGETFILYLPPANGSDDNSAYTSRFSTSMKLDISYVDGNTLKVTASGSGTAKITFHNLETTIQL